MNINYESYPKIFPVGSDATIRVCGLRNDVAFESGKGYTIRAFSKVNSWESVELNVEADEEGVLELCMPLQTEGEYLFDVYREGEDKVLTTEYLFAVPPDLANKKAYKGDMHIHTHYSDGRQSPIFMAVRAKELGLDFIAITDHNRYSPSLEAIEQAKEMGLNLLLMPGEEVSVEAGGGHQVSICASDWVTKYKDDREAYAEEIQEIIENDLKDKKLVEGLTKERYAHAVWTTKKIRELGGYSILAHPYWVAGRKFHLDRLIYGQLLADGLYDAVEVLGDVTFEDNILSVAKYYEETAKGRRIPIVGNSDTHNYMHVYGRYWTLVFAEKCEVESITDAILDMKSVACEHHPEEQLRIFGPFDLVEYAFFLHREFFPLHDRICELEGKLCMRIIEGKDIDRGELVHLRKELDELYKKMWAID